MFILNVMLLLRLFCDHFEFLKVFTGTKNYIENPYGLVLDAPLS